MTVTSVHTLEAREKAKAHDLNAARAVNVLDRHTERYQLAADTIAATTVEFAFLKVPAHMVDGVKVVSIKFTPSATITNGGTDGGSNKTLTFNSRGGTGGAALGTATLTTATGASQLTLTALVAQSVVLSVTTVPAGGILTYGAVPVTNGVVIPAALIEVVYDEL